MSTRKSMKQGSDTKRGSQELVLEIMDGDFRDVALCCFYLYL